MARSEGMGDRLQRIERLFSGVERRIEQVDAALEKHGGAGQLAETLARHADRLVDHVEEFAANLNAVEAEVVDTDAAKQEAEPAPVTRDVQLPGFEHVFWAAAAFVATILLLRRLLR